MNEPNSCSRCNAGMPSFRVNHLCEECFAEEWNNDYDSETDDDLPCEMCGGSGYDTSAPDDGTEDFDICKACWGQL